MTSVAVPMTGIPLTDEELVARSRTGDTESFNQLVRRWERQIFALAYRTLGREEDARDVTQETFLRAFRALNGFRGQAKFSSWLYRIALNLCRDWVRRERRTPIVQASEEIDLMEMAASSVLELAAQLRIGNRSAARRKKIMGGRMCHQSAQDRNATPPRR